MTYATHTQFSFVLLSALTIIKPVDTWQEGLGYLALGGCMSIFPDIDSKTSVSANMIYFFDELLRASHLLKHRGLSHFNLRFIKNKLLMYLIHHIIISILLFYSIFLQNNWVVTSIVVGYCSHLILDDITTFLKIKTGSKFENLFIYNFCGIVGSLGIVYMFYNIIF